MAAWLAASAKERSEFLSRLDRPALTANGEAITVDDVKALKAKLRDYKDRVRDAKATRDSALSSMERLQRENAALRDELNSFRFREERAAPSTPEDAIDEVQERAANGETVTVDVVKELKGKLKDQKEKVRAVRERYDAAWAELETVRAENERLRSEKQAVEWKLEAAENTAPAP